MLPKLDVVMAFMSDEVPSQVDIRRKNINQPQINQTRVDSKKAFKDFHMQTRLKASNEPKLAIELLAAMLSILKVPSS
jgi:hypothetical protein